MENAVKVGSTKERARVLDVMGARIEILVTSEESGGQFGIIEFSIPPLFPGAPLHYHEKMAEAFYVLKGRIELLADETSRVLGHGESALVQPLSLHGYRNPYNERARFLVTAPGHDRFFFDLIEWMQREPVWPPANRNAMVEFGLRHDTFYK